MVLSPNWTSIGKSEIFIEYFLSNKSLINKEIKSNFKQNNLIWYFNPVDRQFEWIKMKDIVNNIVTENMDQVIDPKHVICGCVLMLDQDNMLKSSTSFYNNCSVPVAVKSLVDTGVKTSELNANKCNFFQTKESFNKIKKVTQNISSNHLPGKIKNLKKEKSKKKSLKTKSSKKIKSVEKKRKKKNKSKSQAKSFRISNMIELKKNKYFLKKIGNYFI